MDDRFTCPVCDAQELTAPPYAIWPPPEGMVVTPPYCTQLGMPSYEVCPKCGFEFGNDDDPGDDIAGDSFTSYRDAWIARGRPRFQSPA